MSCTGDEEYLFSYLSSSKTGINFTNTIDQTEEINILNFHYIYNGGGVGVGDFNMDGLNDLVFTGNMVDSKIYLNTGDLTFKDVSIVANFHVNAWATGISIVDINGDGWQDIYISIGGIDCNGECKNKLFIHQGLDKTGIPIFEESANLYNLDNGLYSQQAVFFDYDIDGDLDVYLCQNVIDKRDKNAPSDLKYINKKSSDILLRNDNGIFTDVSEVMGITHRGYGLGVSLADFNKDGLPDIYVANDFLSNDLLYLNHKTADGKPLGFIESSMQILKHQSYNSMGVDLADINNDALQDVIVVDMMPHQYERQKSMIGFMNYEKFLLSLRQEYAAQFIKNSVQLHNGFYRDSILPFTDIGYYTGMNDTDWSWSPLAADFDNDGDKDVFISNGYGKDITDLDFINYSNQITGFGNAESTLKKLFEEIQNMKEIKLSNFFFENKDQLSFEDKSSSWVKSKPSISNGAVYVDLDNDGDLDIVTNNINDEAFILKNNSQNQNYISINLIGEKENKSGIGSMVTIWSNNHCQFKYQSPVKGYLSSMPHQLHFGLGNYDLVDSILIKWPSGKSQQLYAINVNQTITITSKNITLENNKHTQNKQESLVKADRTNIYSHKENIYNDYAHQILLTKQLSKQGPCIITTNINTIKGEEIFIGGPKGFPSVMKIETADGKWKTMELDSKEYEDTGAIFFDMDSDGDQDLYIVSGGSEFPSKSKSLKDRLYLNDGNGHFSKSDMHLSFTQFSGSTVAASDFDKDGDIDLFVGGRLVPHQYPKSPKSVLIENREDSLINITEIGSEIESPGMVTDAIWVDVDRNGWDDLVLTLDWGPIKIFYNKNGQLNETSISIRDDDSSQLGMWNCIASMDADKDGDIDFIVGNQGLNSKFEASDESPLFIVNTDLDKNGSIDPIIGQFSINNTDQLKNYPIQAKDDIAKQLPNLLRGNVSYADFSRLDLKNICNAKISSVTSKVTQLESSYIENLGNSKFKFHTLPKEAQMSPIQDILITDIDADDIDDLFLVGNDYTGEKNYGWHDGFNGLILIGDSKGNFKPVNQSESGFIVSGDARSISLLKDRSGEDRILVGQNSGPLLTFRYSN